MPVRRAVGINKESVKVIKEYGIEISQALWYAVFVAHPGARRKQPMIFGSRHSIKQTQFCVGSIPVQPTKRMDNQQMTRGEL